MSGWVNPIAVRADELPTTHLNAALAWRTLCDDNNSNTVLDEIPLKCR